METESNDDFIDPVNKDEIEERIKNAENHDEIVKIITETFPDWIMGWLNSYSTDYPHFQKNWETMSTKMNTKPLKVIIVKKIVFNDNKYSLISMFCELLTVFGHSVRRKEEFIDCKLCGNALPTPYIYDALKDKGIKIPSVWSPRCSTC